MKLRDIINAVGSRKYWITFHWDWDTSDDGTVIPKMDVCPTLDSEVAVVYQWFHHFNPNVDTKEIWNAIENHDYKTFMKWYNFLRNEDLTYLPSRAAIWIDDCYVGDVCVVYEPETFALISDEDYECG